MLLIRLARFCVALLFLRWYLGLIGPKSDPSFCRVRIASGLGSLQLDGLVPEYAAMAANAPQNSPEQAWSDFGDYVEKALSGRLPGKLLELGPWVARQYVEVALPFARAEFLGTYHSYDGRMSIPSWVTALVDRVWKERFDKIRKQIGTVDEELVRQAQDGSRDAVDELASRYLPQIRKIAASVVYARNICPSHMDKNAFADDVASEASRKVFSRLNTYAYGAPFSSWVYAICENEAYAMRDKEVGRAAQGPRAYLSFDELLEKSKDAAIEDISHRLLLEKLLDDHGRQGTRAQKSTDALRFTFYEGLSAKEVAEKIETTSDYVNQLISHDYKEIRKVAWEDYGISGLDL